MKIKKSKIIVPIVIVLVLAAAVGLIVFGNPYRKIYKESAAQMDAVTEEYLNKLSDAKDTGSFNLAFIQGEAMAHLSFNSSYGITKISSSSAYAKAYAETTNKPSIESLFYADSSGKWIEKIENKYKEDAAKIQEKYKELTNNQVGSSN